MTPNEKKTKSGYWTVRPGAPIAVTEITEVPAASDNLGSSERDRIGKTIKAYLVAVKNLLDSTYSDLKEVAPPHMTGACRPTAFVFPDGILIRYDRAPNPERHALVGTPSRLSKDDGTMLDLSLTTAAPLLSDFFLHCPKDPTTYDPKDQVFSISISAMSATTQEAHEINKNRLFAVAPLPPAGIDRLTTNTRPVPFVSVRNEFEIMMECEIESNSQERRHQYLLAVGFVCRWHGTR
jgi:hypothetical protein